MNLFILLINSKLDLMVSVAHLVLRDYYSIIPRMKESAILAPLNETYLRPTDLASLQSQPWHNADWLGNGATRNGAT